MFAGVDLDRDTVVGSNLVPLKRALPGAVLSLARNPDLPRPRQPKPRFPWPPGVIGGYFENIETESLLGLPAPKGEWRPRGRPWADPVFLVTGYRLPGHAPS